MRSWPSALGSLTLALVLGAPAWARPAKAKAVKTPSRPNLLVILADDLGAHDLGVDGSPFHRTPRLDALAKASVRFTQAYAASPVSSPTRASLMTGRHPARLGITDWIGAAGATFEGSRTPANGTALPVDAPTLGEVFKGEGYATGYVGKWHLGIAEAHPRERGFQWTFAVNGAGQPASYFPPYQSDRPSLQDVPDLEGAEGHLTDRLTDGALQFMAREKDHPWLLVLSHYAVHTPLQPPKEGLAAWQGRARAAEGVAEGAGQTRTSQGDAAYGALLEHLDTATGRLLDGLKALGLDRNTVVVFVSDNGGLSTLEGRPGPTSNAPLRAGKGWLFEGGIRVPFFVKAPGLRPRTVTTPARSEDLMPTLLDLAGLSLRPEVHLDGWSLGPLARGGSLPERGMLWHYPHVHGSGSRPASALREGDLKLVLPWSGPALLFDLATDPGETRNLAPERPGDVKRMTEALRGRLREMGRP